LAAIRYSHADIGAQQPVAVRVQRRPVRRGQLDERPLVAAPRGSDEASVVEVSRRRRGHRATDAGIGGGPPSSVHGDGAERPRHASERHKSHSGRSREDLAQLLGADPDQHPRAQFEALLAGPQSRGALDRDVDLLLVGIRHARIMAVIGVAVPVRRQRHHLHPERRHPQRRPRTPSQPLVDRLHLLEPRDRHVGHLDLQDRMK
jgi:hypothetical protein